MVILGALLCIALVWILLATTGEIGLILVGALAFGLLFSMYMKVKELAEDIRYLKKKQMAIDKNEHEKMEKVLEEGQAEQNNS